MESISTMIQCVFLKIIAEKTNFTLILLQIRLVFQVKII